MNLQVYLHAERLPYTGNELRPHFLLSRFSLRGPALGVFIGPCDVKTEALVDWEDRLAEDFIRSKSMVHFLGEFFGMGLREGVFLQRLFASIIRDELEAQTGKKIIRDGDDLYWVESGSKKKLSVSIVTASPVSQLFHFGLNIDAEGAPVQAAGIRDLLGITGSDTKQEEDASRVLAARILGRFSEEYASIEWACTKVRPVV